MIQEGSKVKLHYKLSVDEEQVESSFDREPLSYTHGEGEIIPGLEEQLAGMEQGDRKTVTVPPDRGYGERNDQAVQEVPKEAFGDVDELNVGDVVSGKISGQPFRATVEGIGEENITLDLNHPLAGKTLTFEVEVVEIG